MKTNTTERWYLRAGDFRVEKASEQEMHRLFGSHFPFRSAIEQLRHDNNLFDSPQEAGEASLMVRTLLAAYSRIVQERQQSAPQTHMPLRNIEPQFVQGTPQTHPMENPTHSDAPQTPIAKTCSCLGDNIHFHVRESDLTVHVHSSLPKI